MVCVVCGVSVSPNPFQGLKHVVGDAADILVAFQFHLIPFRD